MIIRRQTVGERRLSDSIPSKDKEKNYDLDDFLRGIEEFAATDLAGVVEFERFNTSPTLGTIKISPDSAAYLLKLMVKLSGEDGRLLLAASTNDSVMLMMFKLSRGMPDDSEVIEVCRAARSAGFRVWPGDGAIYVEADITPKTTISLGATSSNDFLFTLNKVFFY